MKDKIKQNGGIVWFLMAKDEDTASEKKQSGFSILFNY